MLVSMPPTFWQLFGFDNFCRDDFSELTLLASPVYADRESEKAENQSIGNSAVLRA